MSNSWHIAFTFDKSTTSACGICSIHTPNVSTKLRLFFINLRICLYQLGFLISGNISTARDMEQETKIPRNLRLKITHHSRPYGVKMAAWWQLGITWQDGGASFVFGYLAVWFHLIFHKARLPKAKMAVDPYVWLRTVNHPFLFHFSLLSTPFILIFTSLH